MARVAPFVLGSVGAHLALLVVLYGQVTGQIPLAEQIYQVNAVMQAPEPEAAPEPEPLVSEPLPEPPPPPRRRLRPAPEPALEPPPEPAPAPTPVPVPEPSAAPETPTAEHSVASNRVAVGHPTNAVPPRSPQGSGSQGIPRRRSGSASGGSGGEVCRQVASAFARRLQSAAPYPTWARDMGLEGRMVLNVRVGRDGRARGIRVQSTSGNTGLDRYAVTAARRLGSLPSGCSEPFSVPITYRVRRRH